MDNCEGGCDRRAYLLTVLKFVFIGFDGANADDGSAQSRAIVTAAVENFMIGYCYG